MTTYTYTTLNDPLADTRGTLPDGINDIGQIVGTYRPHINTDAVDGFLYSGGDYTTLSYVVEVAPGAVTTFQTYASGINETGQIVGLIGGGYNTHGFLYSGGTSSTILWAPLAPIQPPLPTASTTRVRSSGRSANSTTISTRSLTTGSFTATAATRHSTIP